MQKAMAQLFDAGVPAISKHLKNMFESGEAGRQYMKHHCNSGTTGDDKELHFCSSSNHSNL